MELLLLLLFSNLSHINVHACMLQIWWSILSWHSNCGALCSEQALAKCLCFLCIMHYFPQHLNRRDVRPKTGSDSCKSAWSSAKSFHRNSDTSKRFSWLEKYLWIWEDIEEQRWYRRDIWDSISSHYRCVKGCKHKAQMGNDMHILTVWFLAHIWEDVKEWWRRTGMQWCAQGFQCTKGSH